MQVLGNLAKQFNVSSFSMQGFRNALTAETADQMQTSSLPRGRCWPLSVPLYGLRASSSLSSRQMGVTRLLHCRHTLTR
jgi:hypothetical protein